MEFLSREHIINDLQGSFQAYIDQYGLDDIGIFEEEGSGNQYFIGYTVKKDGKTYHIHAPFIKNENGELTPIHNDWTIESDEPNRDELSGYHDLDSALREI
jgi:hypothetical protein